MHQLLFEKLREYGTFHPETMKRRFPGLMFNLRLSFRWAHYRKVLLIKYFIISFTCVLEKKSIIRCLYLKNGGILERDLLAKFQIFQIRLIKNLLVKLWTIISSDGIVLIKSLKCLRKLALFFTSIFIYLQILIDLTLSGPRFFRYRKDRGGGGGWILPPPRSL